jgi:hypothetical protein
MQETTARTVSRVGIWLSVAIILAFGVFRFNWNGDEAMLVLLLTVISVCAAATLSTAVVWVGRRRPMGRGFEPLPVSPE